MRHTLSRRRFIAAASFSLAAPAIARAAALMPRGVERIVIVGAGMAGLALAHRLRETGRRVTVLEGRGAPGGRVRTVRSPFDDGLYGELGAARVFDTHFYVQHWINALGLSLIPFSPPEGVSLFSVGGVRARANDPQAGARLFPDLRADERGLTPPQLVNRYIANLPQSLATPETTPQSWREWAALDRATWPQFLRQRGASEAAVRLLTLGADSSQISALYVLRQIMMHREARTYLKVEGGMDRLPRALAQSLGDAVRYGCAVTRIDARGTEPRVTFRTSGRNETLAADRVVVTIPYSCVGRIGVEPAFSAQKAQILREMPYRSVSRFLLQTRTRFWRPGGLSGAARTDAPAELWDASAGQLSARGLISVTAGGRADIQSQLVTLNEQQRVRYGVNIARAAFPEVDGQFQKGVTQNWSEDPWARGGFAVFYPGQMTRWGDSIARNEGRIHFAGEHCSPWQGWIEGALWSADRVFQEILG